MNRREMRKRIWSAVWCAMSEANAGLTIRRNGNKWDKSVVYREPKFSKGLQWHLDTARDLAFKFKTPTDSALKRWNNAEREVMDSIAEHSGINNDP
tara:strand:+ start:3849 stop:4136 length:288 start_codon:yes stop_codon:yes gene_type:complete